MDKIKDLKVLIKEKQTLEEPIVQRVDSSSATNPLLGQIKKNLAQFKNNELSKKFDINDLLR